ncbi:hypothetical protein HDU87_000199 [Geranomyces variabilis]|uniref:Uncharacterized protein n=1 Tax=Geranomyces variabilis TaxID=109894 RepID=A0AAD5XV35_9FUNG|nr:hypothetical protein HDU87_000199 [Geranomyces variabilis]
MSSKATSTKRKQKSSQNSPSIASKRSKSVASGSTKHSKKGTPLPTALIKDLNLPTFWSGRNYANWDPVEYADGCVTVNPGHDFRKICTELLEDLDVLAIGLAPANQADAAKRLALALRNKTVVYRSLRDHIESKAFNDLRESTREIQRSDRLRKSFLEAGVAAEAATIARSYSEAQNAELNREAKEAHCSFEVKEWVEEVAEAGSESELEADLQFEDPNNMQEGAHRKSVPTHSARPIDFGAWILSSGKNVVSTVESARKELKSSQRALSLIWWGILDVSGADKTISDAEVEELKDAFYHDVFLQDLQDDDKEQLAKRGKDC